MSLLEGTNLGKTMERIWDANGDAYVFGASPDGRRALVVNLDEGYCSIVGVDNVESLGRWECSLPHFRAHHDHYAERFPQRP